MYAASTGRTHGRTDQLRKNIHTPLPKESGHWEGDTLVIDTIGQRTDRPYAMVDIYGSPVTEKLHVVKRYRLIDYEEAQDGLDRDAKENQRTGGGRDIDPNYRGKFLQVYFTVEDPNVFTTPWSATITTDPAQLRGVKASVRKIRIGISRRTPTYRSQALPISN